MRKLVLSILLIIFPITGAEACRCVVRERTQSENVRREFKESDAVFSAYVHSVFFVEAQGRKTRMARLRIMQVWKGELAPSTWVEVIADADLGYIGCGYEAEVDQALMVYVHGEPYALAKCSLTGLLDQATSDIPLLNRLSK